MGLRYREKVLLDEVRNDPVGEHTLLTDLESPVTLTKPEGARRIKIQVDDEAIRYRLDGGVPTVSVGFKVRAGIEPIIIPVPNENIRVIRAAPGTKLNYQWMT